MRGLVPEILGAGFVGTSLSWGAGAPAASGIFTGRCAFGALAGRERERESVLERVRGLEGRCWDSGSGLQYPHPTLSPSGRGYRWTGWLLGVLLILIISGQGQAGPGTGFGESLRLQGNAPQAATAGLPLETYYNADMEIYTDQSYLTAGTRWVGIGGEVALFSVLRLGFEGIDVRTGDVPQTVEQSDGSFGGEIGRTNAYETGWRGRAQFDAKVPGGFLVAGRVEVEQLTQDVSGDRGTGMGVVASAFGALPMGEAWGALAWASGGPFGTGDGASFASSVRVGGGVEWRGGLGLVGGAEGLRAGAEAEHYNESVTNVGGGLIYWFGGPDRDGQGARLVLRGGFRAAPDSVAPAGARFGIGFVLRDETGVGWGADYAYVPFGDLGALHYVGARIKLGGGFLPLPGRSSGLMEGD